MSEETGTPPESPVPEQAGGTAPAFPERQEGGTAGDEVTPSRPRRLPRSVYNPISLTGAALAVSMAFAILLIFIVDATASSHSPYLGIIGFAILPVPLIVGLILIPVGMWLESRRIHAAGVDSRQLPVVDMNRQDHRRAFVTFMMGTILFLFLTAGGSYKAYEYTETVEFCGALCHEVMNPEYTTYLSSPHARVKCVECHVGEGVNWYVRSKLSGAYQVYSVLFNRYSRPIATPIENLRPARETCERCHWPEKFHGDQMWEVARYMSDEANTRWRIRMVMKTGGSDEATGQVHGIHWHIAQRLEYVPADSTRMAMREVRHYLPDGTVKVFSSSSNPLSEGERAALGEGDVRVMDCMDCHNRPSHQYLSPRHAMDRMMEDNIVPRDLPFVKRQGSSLLAASYETRGEGQQAIEEGLRTFYAQNYPDLVAGRPALVDSAVTGVEQAFDTFFFPYMRARWSAYPTDIGHQEFPGCFRCHGGDMTAEDGSTISMDCQLCHVIMNQGPEASGFQTTDGQGLVFKHPVDIGEAWKFMSCSDCHTGGGY